LHSLEVFNRCAHKEWQVGLVFGRATELAMK